MRITWDKVKNARNLKKHKIDFETAKLVFDDPNQLTMQDRIENGEYRWLTLGIIGAVLVAVGHTVKEEDGKEVLRIITARKATPKERRQYHEETYH